MQSKLTKPAMVAFGDLSAEAVHEVTGSLSFLSYTKTGIIIFYGIYLHYLLQNLI